MDLMRKSKTPPVSSGSPDDIEAAFYEALQAGDIDRLMACWSDEDDMFCIHPGGAWLVGPAAIRQAFEAMFASGTMGIKAVKVRKLDGLGSSIHSVLERVEVLTQEGLRHIYVMATNVYHETPLGWRLMAHHASPGSAQEMQEVAPIPMLLH